MKDYIKILKLEEINWGGIVELAIEAQEAKGFSDLEDTFYKPFEELEDTFYICGTNQVIDKEINKQLSFIESYINSLPSKDKEKIQKQIFTFLNK
jgi:hypothetical protein